MGSDYRQGKEVKSDEARTEEIKLQVAIGLDV